MIIENIVVGEGTKYPLKGILTLPEDRQTQVPAVVFVHGSGSRKPKQQLVMMQYTAKE